MAPLIAIMAYSGDKLPIAANGGVSESKATFSA